jgi:hypothetical protein
MSRAEEVAFIDRKAEESRNRKPFSRAENRKRNAVRTISASKEGSYLGGQQSPGQCSIILRSPAS